jgi:hypothetical protein
LPGWSFLVFAISVGVKTGSSRALGISGRFIAIPENHRIANRLSPMMYDFVRFDLEFDLVDKGVDVRPHCVV